MVVAVRKDTLTDAILAAVRRELEARRALYDAREDIGEVVITVKLEIGTVVVKSVGVQDLHINRRYR